MWSIELRDEARAELRQAFAWYQEKQPGLGFQFLYSVDAAFARIRRHPRAFPLVEAESRRAVLRRFPYTLIFELEQDRIMIHAVYHGSRRPGGWADRVSELIAVGAS